MQWCILVTMEAEMVGPAQGTAPVPGEGQAEGAGRSGGNYPVHDEDLAEFPLLLKLPGRDGH